MDYSKIAYAKVNLTYDKEIFIEEYDKKILPSARQIMSSFELNKKLADLNKIWKMVPENIYENGYCWRVDSNGQMIKLTENRVPTWKMNQLMQLKEEVSRNTWSNSGKKVNYGNSTSALRNTQYNKIWEIKPEFADLTIVKYIKSLPFKKIIFMHCVSLEANQFATIHRDITKIPKTNKYHLAQEGFITLTFNISDGGVPLYWALDGEESKIPYKVNDDVYITNDYFLHGVPVTTSRRRQIRVTGIPDENFESLIDKNTMITIPDDYAYNDIWGIDNR